MWLVVKAESQPRNQIRWKYGGPIPLTFDLTRLADHDIGRAALADRELLADVVRHKKVFFHVGYANYDRCLDGRLRLVPDDDQLPGLKADYDAMRAAAIVADDAPAFDELIEDIRALEADANRPG